MGENCSKFRGGESIVDAEVVDTPALTQSYRAPVVDTPTLLQGYYMPPTPFKVCKPDRPPAKQDEAPFIVTLPKAANGWRLPSHYEVRKCLGKGSYGCVCECFDRQKQKYVAAKQLKDLFHDLTDAKRVLREITILTQLNSDNVVRVEDFIVPERLERFDELYIVLEICDSDLKVLTKTNVSLDPIHVNTMLYSLLVGLKYIHSAGVYHRDLKPANCLVNQNCQVKICDFGLSRALGAQAMPNSPDSDAWPQSCDAGKLANECDDAEPLHFRRRLTQHVVTRWYRAPELILLQKGYDAAVDVWSVGCIFAELLQMQDNADISFSDRGPLFPGGSCYPLSPGRNKNKRSSNDQLEVIFSVTGSPSEKEIAELDSEGAKKYLRGFETVTGIGVSAELEGVGSLALDLLDRMLRFSPKNRCNVQDAIADPLLATVRKPSAETTADRLVEVSFDDEAEMCESDLRRCFGVELRKFQEHIGLVPAPAE